MFSRKLYFSFSLELRAHRSTYFNSGSHPLGVELNRRAGVLGRKLLINALLHEDFNKISFYCEFDH